MRTPELRRTTTFRLASLFGLVFAVGVVLLLGLVYWRTASVLGRRADAIVRADAAILAQADPAALPDLIRRQDAGAPGRLDAYGLFSQDGVHVAGVVKQLPEALSIDGPLRDVSPRDGFPFAGRAMARRLPWGEVLVVGRDASQIAQVRGIVLEALVWSGGLIAVLGLAGGVALSLGPLRRLQALQAASGRIMAGDLGARMPIAGRRDELDLFAGMVNLMVEEVERLLGEVKGANDAVAHNLRTPLTRVRARLARLQGDEALPDAAAAVVGEAIEDLDLTLERFRALLRVSQIEAQDRRKGMRTIDAPEVLRRAVELYEPLAEAQGVTLAARLPAACAAGGRRQAGVRGHLRPAGQRHQVLERRRWGRGGAGADRARAGDVGARPWARDRGGGARGGAAALPSRRRGGGHRGVRPGTQHRGRHREAASLRPQAGGCGAWPPGDPGLFRRHVNGERPAWPG